VHPREAKHWGTMLNRREFLVRSTGTVLALSGTSLLLAACQERDDGGVPSGIPSVTPGGRVELPLYEDNAAIGDGLSPEAGPLRIFSWNDYVYKKVLQRFQDKFSVEIDYTGFGSMAEGINKVENQVVDFDLFFPETQYIGNLALAKLIQPLNHSYLPNFVANIWPELQDPYYDGGARYSVPYLTWKTGIGYRRDLVASEPTGDAPSAFGIAWDPAYKGLVGAIDGYRDTVAMALLRNGGDDVNSGDPAEIDAAKQALLELNDLVGVNIGVSGYQALAEGTHAIQVSQWSGDMNWVRYYLPKGTSVDVVGFYYPPGGVVGNDSMVISRTSKNPVLAHEFINFLMDPVNALDNFGYEGYQPPLVGIETPEWLDKGNIPANLQTTIVTGEDFATGQQLQRLTPDVDQMWQDAWAEFIAGAKAGN
jgi:spermidine/putrescine transport system substrate-binding protein